MVDPISISPPDSLALNNLGFLKILHNSLHRTFCNSDLQGNFAKHDIRLPLQQSEHMCMIRQKRPARERTRISIGSFWRIRWAEPVLLRICSH